MSRDASTKLVFGGDEQTFRLRIGELRELEEARKAGALAILKRILSGDHYVDDAREVIRIGLIGGGMTAKEAFVLTTRYVDDIPAHGDNMALAGHILEAAYFGPEDEKVGKPPAATQETTNSTLPPSTPTAQ
jgi:hypothetical protein